MRFVLKQAKDKSDKQHFTKICSDCSAEIVKYSCKRKSCYKNKHTNKYATIRDNNDTVFPVPEGISNKQ